MSRLARQALEEIAQDRNLSRNAREVSLSKALSLLLRHNAVRAGMTIRGDGFCLMDEVLEAPDLRILGATAAEVEGLVHTSPKQRFELRREEGGFLIRAVQGHSMPEVRDDLLLRSLSVFDEDLPQLCVHGTKERHLTSILLRGLLAGGRRRSRTHVHFQPYRPGDERVVSGMRDGSEIAIYLDLRRALVDGIPFSVSRNNVILSPGIDGVIPPRYIVDVQRLEGLEVSTESVPSTASGSAEGPRDEAQTLAIAERLGVVLRRDEQTPYLGPPTPPGESASTGALPLPVASNRDRLRRIAGRLEILAGLTVDADIEWLPGSDDCLANLEALTAEIEAAGHPAELPPGPQVDAVSTSLVQSDPSSRQAPPVAHDRSSSGAVIADQASSVGDDPSGILFIAAHDFNSEPYNKSGTVPYLSVVGGATRLQRLHAVGNDEHWHLARADGIVEGWVPTYCFPVDEA